NFYCDSDYSQAGYQWLTGALPDLWSEASLLYREAGNRADLRPRGSTSAGPLWHHLKEHTISFRILGEKNRSDIEVPDQHRASEFISALRTDSLDPGKPLPELLWLSLPNDTAGPASPDRGYPYEASYVADNDLALGKIVEFLSHTPWWKEMAIFATE